MTRPLEAWDSLVRAIAEEVPEATFSAWVAPLVAEDNGGELCLRCLSAFHCERVRERFLPRIEAGLREHGGGEVRVVLQVDPHARARLKRRSTMETRAPQNVAPQARSARSTPPPAGAAPGDKSVAPPLGAPSAMAFDTFVVGTSNALAREAGLAVAQGRQVAMSPLYLVAGPGLGKSHLANAIAVEARKVQGARATLVSAEQFTNELTHSIRAKRTADFKFRYREDVDLLIIEDVEFVQGKRATQDELFHTLDALTRQRRRVVLTAARMPREIPNLDPRLASRMSGGLCAEIEIPDREHRRLILRTKAAAGGVRLPSECLDELADTPFESVRDLESTLVQLVANAALLKRAVDVALVRAALRRAGISTLRRRGPVEIANEAAAFFGSSLEALSSSSRRRDVVWPRQVAMFLCHRLTPASTGEIGALFGRGHSPVRNAIRVVERAILERAPRRYQVEALMERLDPEGGLRIEEERASRDGGA